MMKLRDRFLFCCGWSWASRWCWLDVLTSCKFRAICDRHDRAITDPFDEHWSRTEFDRLMAAGEPVEITPGPRPILATMPDWAAEAAVWRTETGEMTEEATLLWGEDWNSSEDAIYDSDARRDA